MNDTDAVVVGAGLNGLVAALVLAGAGLRVTVVEAAARPGGALRSEECTLPGFIHDIGATVHALGLASPALRALRKSSGSTETARFVHPSMPLGHAVNPGASVLLHRSHRHTATDLGRDGARWSRTVGSFGAHWPDLAASVLDVTHLPPRAPLTLARFGLYGAPPAALLARVVFQEEPARALFAGLAAHSFRPLTAPGSAAFGVVLGALAHGVGWPVVEGGSGRLVDELVARLRALGAEVVTGMRVTDLAELPSAEITILDVDAGQFARIAGDRLPSRYRRRLQRWRYGPAAYKVDWALDGPIPWADPALADAGTVHLGGAAAEVIASEAAVAGGRVSSEPYVLLVQATVADPSRAPAGKHTGWAYIHVPNGWTGDATALIESRIEHFAPGFRDRILARHVWTPAALEAWDAALVGGDIGGGTNDLWQLLARPRLSTT
ncbi:phytoene desaturase family protein, partial [Microbacterium sp.]|uniref:phytoene desaturase family protein n=1 Tax=Microbacterium sp. TaxID=51671 RepID=UPI003C7365A6